MRPVLSMVEEYAIRYTSSYTSLPSLFALNLINRQSSLIISHELWYRYVLDFLAALQAQYAGPAGIVLKLR